jgi:hypothetical protein
MKDRTDCFSMTSSSCCVYCDDRSPIYPCASAGDISSGSEDDALTQIRRIDPATPASPMHKLYLSEQAEMGGMVPTLHMHGPQGTGLDGAGDDNSIGSNSCDDSVGSPLPPGAGAGAGYTAEGTRASRRKKRKLKKPKKLDEMAEGKHAFPC